MAEWLLMPPGAPRLLVVAVAAGIVAAIWMRRRWCAALDECAAPPAQGGGGGSTRCLVIVARDEEERLPGLLWDLERLLDEDKALEILLADDASRDGTRRLLESFCAGRTRARLLPACPQLRGKPAWLRAAVAEGCGAQVLLSDADCRLPRGWSLALGGLLDEGLAAAGGPVLLERQAAPAAAARWQRLHWILLSGAAAALSARAAARGRGEAPSLWGGNLAFDRARLEALGGYAALAAATSNEDLTLARALARRGAPTAFRPAPPSLRVRTAAVSWSDCARQQARWATGLARLSRRQALPVLLALLWLAALAGVLLARPLLGLLLGAAGALTLASLLSELAARLGEDPVPPGEAALYLAAWPALALGALWHALRGDLRWRRSA